MIDAKFARAHDQWLDPPEDEVIYHCGGEIYKDESYSSSARHISELYILRQTLTRLHRALRGDIAFPLSINVKWKCYITRLTAKKFVSSAYGTSRVIILPIA